ncbi:tetratricopeptide repeat protein [Muricauda sp. DJ-13]|uniref:Tetratricopeptide repeat protein n=2 Tax=Croceivirga thetidis TaxID=2721623 RepID=A0ABX1GS36_9FLAO|nr:tetratricopeptide repeat protein [Croceivirga thetidis]
MAQKRQLAAIVFTDIQGYTALMQKDEKVSLEIREKHRKIFDTTTKKHNGKIIQYFGDGTLSTFSSSVEAVHSSIELQKKFIDADIPVRIGIHVGDIIQTENDIIGDAVNVASRIESCAIAGSVLISDKIHDQIRSHPEIKATFLDAYELKNVSDAIPVFAISNEGLRVPTSKQVKENLSGSKPNSNKSSSIKKKIGIVLGLVGLLILAEYFGLYDFTYTVTDRSIAVLPFENLSTDADSEIFRDGITYDIVNRLSHFDDLHVISQTSVKKYKDSDMTVPEIAAELGVTYILEGSIRKYGNDVRITSQLINAKLDEPVWVNDYDRTLTDIIQIQSEITTNIVDELKLNINFEQEKSIAKVSTQNIEAYKLFLQGREEADKRNKGSIAKSIELYQKAIDIDPNYAEAYAEIANSIFLQTYYGNADPTIAAEKAETYLTKAEKIDDNISRLYTVKGLLYNHTKQFEKAQVAFERAIKLSPNDVTARHQYATYFYYTGQYQKQLEQTKIAYALDPLSFASASSYFSALTYNKKYDDAEKLIEEIRKQHTEADDFIVNRLYMRLYMAKPDFQKAIAPTTYLSNEDKNYYRFLGYSYGQLGDTINALRIVDSIKKMPSHRMQNHRIAVVFAGLKESDSVFHYLDTSKNKSKLFNNNAIYYFDYIKTDPRYSDLLHQHNISK